MVFTLSSTPWPPNARMLLSRMLSADRSLYSQGLPYGCSCAATTEAEIETRKTQATDRLNRRGLQYAIGL